MCFVYGYGRDGRGHGGRERVSFLTELLLTMCEIAFFVEGAVAFIGEVPAEAGFIIVLLFAHQII